MKSKISLFNRSLIMSNIKRFWWVSALYFVGLIILFQLNLLQIMNKASIQGYHSSTSELVSLGDTHSIFLWIVPIFVGVLMFQFIHKSKATSMLHALPFSRTTLFINQLISGLILMFIPVILNGIILIILNVSTTLKEAYTIPHVLIVTGLAILFETLIFSSTIFIGMLTGNSLAHFIFTYIFHLIPIAVYYTITGFLTNMLMGFTNLNSTFLHNTILGTPLFKGISLYSGKLVSNSLPYDNNISSTANSVPEKLHFIVHFSTLQLTIYLCVTLLFISAALLLYKKRNLETATDIISFKVIRPIFKYGVTISVMVIGSIYIMGIVNVKPNIPSIVVWSFIGYCITEMLLTKSLKIWRSYKGFLIYIAIAITLFLMISNDLFGFINKIPNINDVRSVYIGDKYTWDQPSSQDKSKYVGFSLYYKGMTFTEPSNIEYVENLHRKLIDENKNVLHSDESLLSGYNYYNNNDLSYIAGMFLGEQGYDESRIYIIYTMKNGSQVVRNYKSDYMSNYTNSTIDFEPLLSSSEYYIEKYPIFRQNPEDIKAFSYANVIISQKDQIAEFVASMKEDMKNWIDNRKTITINGDNVLYPITINANDEKDTTTYSEIKKDGKTAKWLADHGY